MSGTLTTDVDAALTALDARESDVAALGLQSLVLGQIQTLQSDTDTYGATLVKIIATDLQSEAQSDVAALDTAFATATAAYS